MVKNKTEEDYIPETEEEDFEMQQGERSIDKPAFERLIDTQQHLKALEKQFKGHIERDGRWEKVSEEIATDKFIDKMVGGLRSIINQFTIYTYIGEEDAEKILLEKNEEFIRACVDESSVENINDIELMVNIYDHALQTFMGLPTKGHGSIFLRDLGGGLSQGLEHIQKNKSSIFDGLGNIFSIGGKSK